MRMHPRQLLLTCLASGLGTGFSKVAPGTFGSAAFCLMWFGLSKVGYPPPETSLLSAFFLLVLFTITSFVTVHSLCTQQDDKDPQWIVIDEWLGLSVPLLLLGPLQFWDILLVFVVFRLFDVTKCAGISYLERLPGAWGILMDDVAAGVYTLIILLPFI